MNKCRRISIQKIVALLEVTKSDLDLIAEQEQDAFDNIPESLWETERYEHMEECLDELNEAIDNLGDVIVCLTEVTE